MANIEIFVDQEGNAIGGVPELLVTIYSHGFEDKTKVANPIQIASFEILQQLMDMGGVQGFSSQFDRLEELLW